MKVRKASKAGQFYPGSKGALTRSIEESFENQEFGPGHKLQVGSGSRKTVAAICPHAGYEYSACAAAWSYNAIFSERAPDVVIILGTIHTHYRGIAVLDEGVWQTPLGQAEIDSGVATKVLEKCSLVKADDNAFLSPYHFGEHNIEVQIPFLQYCNPKTKIVPITVGTFEIKDMEALGLGLAETIKTTLDKDIVVIASSDMTHKEVRDPDNPEPSVQDQRVKDQVVIDKVKNMDIRGTLNAALQTTVCGPQTITTAMFMAKALGATKVNVWKYYVSYEKMGSKPPCDYSVGYLSATFGYE